MSVLTGLGGSKSSNADSQKCYDMSKLTLNC